MWGLPGTRLEAFGVAPLAFAAYRPLVCEAAANARTGGALVVSSGGRFD